MATNIVGMSMNIGNYKNTFIISILNETQKKAQKSMSLIEEYGLFAYFQSIVLTSANILAIKYELTL